MSNISESNGSKEAPDLFEKRSNDLNAEFQKSIWELFAKYQQDESVLNPTQFYQTLALSMLSCAAVVAVDVHINDMQFVGMAKKLWDSTHAKAPKFS